VISAVQAGPGDLYSVAIDAGGNLYVGDIFNEVIRRVDAKTGNMDAIGPDISGLAVNGAGVLYFSDNENGVVRRVDFTTGEATPFGPTPAGSTSSPDAVAITNIGNQPLHFSAFTASDEFAIVPPRGASDCAIGTSLAVGDRCTVQFTFRPMTIGAIDGTITIADDALNLSPATQGIAVSGTGQQGSQTISFPQVALVCGTPAQLTATASSGLPVTYAVNGPATLAGSTLTPTALGSATVTAAQAGNSSFTAATAVPKTVAVGPTTLSSRIYILRIDAAITHTYSPHAG
jgi:hypothetical protein